MKRFLSYLFLLQIFLFQLNGAHKSKIEDIKNSQQVSVLNDFWNDKIKNKSWFESSSSSDDCNGITCFATYNGFAKRAREQFKSNEVLLENPNRNSSPRCHSEVFLLCALKEDVEFYESLNVNFSLDDYCISIQNEFFPPCSTPYGKTYLKWNEIEKRLETVMECNPGITCDKYINQFANENECKIVVEYPKMGSPKTYPSKFVRKR